MNKHSRKVIQQRDEYVLYQPTIYREYILHYLTLYKKSCDSFWQKRSSWFIAEPFLRGALGNLIVHGITTCPLLPKLHIKLFPPHTKYYYCALQYQTEILACRV